MPKYIINMLRLLPACEQSSLSTTTSTTGEDITKIHTSKQNRNHLKSSLKQEKRQNSAMITTSHGLQSTKIGLVNSPTSMPSVQPCLSSTSTGGQTARGKKMVSQKHIPTLYDVTNSSIAINFNKKNR